jgi:hypothetical protein
LKLIQQEPGIDRLRLHRHLCNHMESKELSASLIRLKDRCLIRSKVSPTKGKCWFPCYEETKEDRRKQLVLDKITDLLLELMYPYDGGINIADIEELIKNGSLSKEEIIAQWAEAVNNYFTEEEA